MSGGQGISAVAEVRGVDQYIWVDPEGNILAQDTRNPEQFARMVVSCTRPLYEVGKTKFRQVVFLRENQENIFIFPVGNGYLGVIKQRGVEDDEMVRALAEFLNAVSGQRGK
ncbi:roadblock/LC7 domain-containing protein [Desulfospira joergensenii]|uniref:roadblock/LC7 domain-containing protein n=1 Tax=Desulfospira joergensenii TaxID=53329 RepID=UPI0003B42666|nr:roadblock/LC7 domain-containing protein [Desulfospira joergensenii]